MIKTSKRILLVGNEYDSFYYVTKTTSGKFLVIEVDTQTEITDDTDVLRHPVVVHSRESFNKLLNERWIKHGLITREEADIMLNQDDQEEILEPVIDVRPYELGSSRITESPGISSLSYESNLLVPTEPDAESIPFSEMKEGMLVKDKDGMTGFIENCDDIHNIQVRYGSGGSGMGLFCVDPGCDDYDKLYKIITTTGTKTAKSEQNSPLKLSNVRTIMADIQREMNDVLKHTINNNPSPDDMSKLIIDVIKSRCPYDVEKHFQVTAELSGNEIMLTPRNLITALWVKGLLVDPNTIVNEYLYEDEIAVYQFDDEKGLCITPKASANLF
jgi:hypothetical protein